MSRTFNTPDDDPEMEQAKVRARQTFRFFWREMAWEKRRIIPGLQVAAVKAAFSDPPKGQARNPNDSEYEVEQMWISDVEFDGRMVSGTLLNSPVSLRSVTAGDRVSFGGKQLSDWMYVIDGEPYGGFTVDLMRSRMDKRERKDHDEAWGFDFPKVGTVNLVPASFLDAADAAAGGQQNPAKVAAKEHPMSVNMWKSLAKMFADNPGAVHEVDDLGFSMLHDLALAGSYHGVEVCLKHGADPNLRASNGLTPFALAKVFQWKRVMAQLEKAGGA